MDWSELLGRIEKIETACLEKEKQLSAVHERSMNLSSKVRRRKD